MIKKKSQKTSSIAAKKFDSKIGGRLYRSLAHLYHTDIWLFATYCFLFIYGLVLLLAVNIPEDDVGMGDTLSYLIFHPGRTLAYGVVLKIVSLVFNNFAAIKIIQIPAFVLALGFLANRLMVALPHLLGRFYKKSSHGLVFLLVLASAGNIDTIYLHYILLSDSLFCAMVMVIVGLMINLWLAPTDQKNWRHIGLALGTCMLLRPAIMPFIILLPIFFLMVFGAGAITKHGKKLLLAFFIIAIFVSGQKLFDRWLNHEPQKISASLLYGNANMLASPAHRDPFMAGSLFDRVWQFYQKKYLAERQLVDGLPARYCVTSAYQHLAVNYVIWGLQPWWGKGFLAADVFTPADRQRFMAAPQAVTIDPYLDEKDQNTYTRAVFMANPWATIKLFACNYANVSFHGYDGLFANDDHYQNIFARVMATLIYNKEQSINHDYADFLTTYKRLLLVAATTHQLTVRDIIRFIGYRESVVSNVLKMAGGEDFAKLHTQNEFSPSLRATIFHAYAVAQGLPNGNYSGEFAGLNIIRGFYTAIGTLGFFLSWLYIISFLPLLWRGLRRGLLLPLLDNAARPLLLPTLLAMGLQGYLITLALVAVYESRYIAPLFPIMLILIMTAPSFLRHYRALFFGAGKKRR